MLLIGIGGCASSNQTDGAEEDEPAPREARPPGPDLAPPARAIRTIQLYPGDDERRLPITSLRSGPPLTLEFDLMEPEGRPLTIRFRHADRHWEEDLSPSRALESYTDDALVEYQSSRGTEVDYTHYTYRFPNDDIRFRTSGNYVLQVTERGRRDSVLFEQPFFVTEGEGDLDAQLEPLAIPGQQQPSVRPLAQFDPPASLQGSPFGYTACFVRNGRLGEVRCEDRPLLASQPRLEFEVDRRRAFAPVTIDYTVNLGTLQGGSRIERTDRTVSPFRVLLEPDYARFSGGLPEALLNGQIVVRDAVRGRANPALTAEYVQTTFAFVPPNEQPVRGGLTVAGSFSGMNPARGTDMRWVTGRGRYEGEVLLKQGQYQYFYASDDPALTDELRRMQSVRRQNVYTTFIYYEDPSRGTDRLLQVGSVQR
jgi:hypothetical protein